jgi:transposase-like protein
MPPHFAEKIFTSRTALEGERNRVTVLFANLKGSMGLGDQAGPTPDRGLAQEAPWCSGNSRYVDETYIKVQGQWRNLYRAIDLVGHLVDVRLSDTRGLAAAEAFFRSAWTVTGVTPDCITTDGHDAYPRAIRTVFGDQVTHRTNRYLNSHVEQDHRGIKQRHRSTSGLKTFATAARFCRAFDEIRAFLRPQLHRKQLVTLAHRRHIHQDRFGQLMGMIAAA